LVELNPGISGLEKCPGSRDFGIPGLMPYLLTANPGIANPGIPVEFSNPVISGLAASYYSTFETNDTL